ncbi:MAG: glycosyltransferase family 2 protein [Candidatus Gastranaerophilales bacterium]|nr:glycosyltransferase family 2 protein [Candidatus Gastranaerophilales bacterium]
MQNPKLALVIPCYNEEEVIETTVKRLLEVMETLSGESCISAESFVYLVNDGSKDATWNIIQKLHSAYPDKVKAINFTRNFGNQRAILAGLLEVKKHGIDCCITLDADLQQDENKIKDFVEKYKGGAQIVCGIRNDRKTDGFMKKHTAQAFYKIMNMLGVKIKPNHSDFRLTSSQVLDILGDYREVNLFLRGIFYEFGYKTEYVYFDVKPRFAGTSKYSAWDLFSLAAKGITSFSVVPLRMVTFVGFIISLFSFILCLSVVYEKLSSSYTLPGWSTIVAAITFIGGIQILSIGIIGEYLGQLFQEVKARPRYIIETELS